MTQKVTNVYIKWVFNYGCTKQKFLEGKAENAILNSMVFFYN